MDTKSRKATHTPTLVKTMSIPNFQTTKAEALVIMDIVRRAEKMGLCKDRLSMDMDITAVHCNGRRLDLKKLLNFPDFDFAHDICGIQRHINRTNGKLLDYFLPRCSAKAEASNP